MSAATLLDRYLPGDSIVHRADPRLKLALTLAFILATATLPPGAWLAFAPMIGIVWGAVLLSRLSVPRVAFRSTIALPFAMVALPTIFNRPGDILFEIDVGLTVLEATTLGLTFFATVLLKSWTSVTAAVLLTATTPQIELLRALRAFRVPSIIIMIVSMTYRYLFVLTDEAQRMLRARQSRSASAGARSGGSVAWRARVTGNMAGSLFLRSLDRSERIYQAMLARGYDGTVRRIGDAPRAGRLSVAAGGFGFVLLAAIAAAARMPY